MQYINDIVNEEKSFAAERNNEYLQQDINETGYLKKEALKKQEEKRSISLSRTWYICDCKLTVNISDSTKGSAIHQY